MSFSYQEQLQAKIDQLQQQFSAFEPAELQVYPSPPEHYRMRAEFRIWHTEDDLFYAMFERDADGNKKVKRVDQFPIACQSINALMPRLLAKIKANPVLAKRLFEINFLATLNGDILVSLLYHRALDQCWQQQATDLAKTLDIQLIGRSRGQKIVLDHDFVIEHFNVLGRDYSYQQIEGGFSQPNAVICEKMLTWAAEAAASLNSQKDLLELYCGNANFTLPLALYFPKVLATELSKSSVRAAEYNIEKNGVKNISIARLSAEEFTEAYRGDRVFRRLKQANIELEDYQFDTVFVDPPRAGIDDQTLDLLMKFKNIIYISCNPDTLQQNISKLSADYQISRWAMFDQFPHTHHIESAMLLTKK